MSSQKIKPRDVLSSVVATLKRAPQKVVFTNGCFDLLHVGHIRYLTAAKQLGDILIVGLNSDASVQRLKGPTRPLNSQADRAEVLAALEMVDYVTIFEEETPIRTLELLQPNIHVKGGDYQAEDLPEAPTVEGYGGKIVIVPFVEGKSTTTLIKKIESLGSLNPPKGGLDAAQPLCPSGISPCQGRLL